MSYVSAVHPGPASLTSPSPTIRMSASGFRRPAATLLTKTTSLVSASLEATLLVAMMSGLSLVLCTIAAGAL